MTRGQEDKRTRIVLEGWLDMGNQGIV